MGHIRIIGGKWRGRSLSVIQREGLRPTPSRVRETLFNWLAPTIQGARCLDCFAGSGILGFEALSRGASSLLLLEKAKPQIINLKKTATQLALHETQLEIKQVDTLQWLSTNKLKVQFDVIFLDPPFEEKLWEPCLTRILNGAFCHNKTLVYVESPVKPASFLVQDPWKVVKQKQAGNVKHQLLRLDTEQEMG